MCTIPPEEWSTEWGKKLHTKLMAIFLSNVNRFLRLIHRARFSSKFEVNWLLRMPPHFENRLGFDRSTAMIYGRKFDVQFFGALCISELASFLQNVEKAWINRTPIYVESALHFTSICFLFIRDILFIQDVLYICKQQDPL